MGVARPHQYFNKKEVYLLIFLLFTGSRGHCRNQNGQNQVVKMTFAGSE